MADSLDELVEGRAAGLADYGGVPVATTFGDTVAEWHAIDSAAGLIDLRFCRLLAAEGTERHEFLHGQLTNHIKDLREGAGCGSLLLAPEGRPRALLAVYDEGERLLISLDAALLESSREALERFIVTDDCEFEVLPAVPHIGLVGPEAASVLAEAGVAGLGAEPGYSITHGEISGERVTVLARGDLRVPCFDLAVTAAGDAPGDGAAVWQALEALGAVPAGTDAYEIVRVESGTARYGVDVDESRLAMEPRLEWAIHFNKGCYVGQEVVERSVSRGRLNRELALIALDGVVARGDHVSGGAEAAVVTSVVDSPARGKLCLAYLGRKQTAAGTAVTIETESGEVAGAVLEWQRPMDLTGRD